MRTKKDAVSYSNEKGELALEAVLAIKKNSKYLYSYARKFKKISTDMGPLVGAANDIISCPVKMANMLVEQCKSVFSTPKEKLSDTLNIFPNDPP